MSCWHAQGHVGLHHNMIADSMCPEELVLDPRRAKLSIIHSVLMGEDLYRCALAHSALPPVLQIGRAHV